MALQGNGTVQAGEQEKQKSYLATCRLPCPVTPDMLDKISATENLVLQQRTPTRVEHRRAMLVRTCIPAQLTILPPPHHGASHVCSTHGSGAC